jgi:hypothetical protein
MGQLIPDGLLTIRDAAEKVAAAMYAGVPDRSSVTQFREQGFDVADGAAIDDATSEIWAAVDKGKVEPFVNSAKSQMPLRVPADILNEIPTLRSSKYGSFSFLRHRNRHYPQIVAWFGSDFRNITVVFRYQEIMRLSRSLLRTRRRRETQKGNRGRPSAKAEVKKVIREIIDHRKWFPTESLKALTNIVNRKGILPKLVSEDTVIRSLDELHAETGDRRFQRVRRVTR